MPTEPDVRKWHRTIGLLLAPLLFLQALSGLVMAFELILGLHQDVASLLNAKDSHALHYAWEYLLLDIHFGSGKLGATYHSLLVLGSFFLIGSGTYIYYLVRKRSRKKT